MSDTFPRQYARTQRFSLGEPRNLHVSDDGRRVVFLRSAGGSDPVNSLWVLDVDSGEERVVADARQLLGDADEHDTSSMTPEERAQRERLREGAGGITAYATDAKTTVVAFAVGGQLFAAGLLSGRARRIDVEGPVFDPRPDPTARRVAYVSGSTLRIGELDGRSRVLAGDGPDEGQEVSWGSPDFIAAEEMGRYRGYWWSPDGESIAACRVDESPVAEWVIADPAMPGAAARTIRYPAAGTDNAVVTLHILGLDGRRIEVDWDREFFPYIATVDWTEAGLLASVVSRDQRGSMTLLIDATSGETTVVAHDYDDAWIELVPGLPRLLPDGRVVTAGDRDGARRLFVDGTPVTPPDLQVRGVLSSAADTIVFQANAIAEPAELHVWRWDDGELTAITTESGVHTAAVGGSTTVVRSSTLDEPGARVVTLDGHRITTFAERPLVTPNVEIFTAGERGITTAVLLPHGHDGSPLPVLLDPYGGPHALRVQRSSNAFASAQWFADQGFAVVVADGRGTPGRGHTWERSVHLDLATAPLDDQIDALHGRRRAVPRGVRPRPRRDPGMEFRRVSRRPRRPPPPRRVPRRGRRCAGHGVAPLRHLLHRAVSRSILTMSPNGYDASSLLPLAPGLTRPLLLVHGLADDNVVAAHTLQLSAALLAAGRPHEVLPLVGVSHMTPQEAIAENLLLHQLDFLRRSLGIERTT